MLTRLRFCSNALRAFKLSIVEPPASLQSAESLVERRGRLRLVLVGDDFKALHAGVVINDLREINLLLWLLVLTLWGYKGLDIPSVLRYPTDLLGPLSL